MCVASLTSIRVLRLMLYMYIHKFKFLVLELRVSELLTCYSHVCCTYGLKNVSNHIKYKSTKHRHISTYKDI